MKQKILFLTCVIALLMASSRISQSQVAPLFQNQTVSTVAVPVNTPLLGSGLNCVAGATGLAANTYVVAYTYTGVASSSESKASSDGGATLTTLVTCPANGVLTIPSPPFPPGCPSSICSGWRPYVIASSSGTAAELLQTISSSTCVLSTTSNLTSCAFGQSFTETSLGAGAAEPANPTLFIAPVIGTTMGAFQPLNETGLNFSTHFLAWTTTGTAATCTFTLQNSSDNVTFSTVGTTQTCTSSGSYLVSVAAANFMRVNLTAFTATGANVPSITFTLVDYPTNVPTYTVTNCGTVAACAPNATLSNSQIKIVYGVCTLAGNVCTVTGIPGYTSTTSYVCTATDETTAQLIKIANASATSTVITDTVGATDVVHYVCVGT